MKKTLLDIQDLVVTVENKKILDGISLHVKTGEIHAITGANGAGKSTLAKVIAGFPSCQVTGGTLHLFSHDAATMTPEQRAHLGLFVSFQNPVEIAGLPNAQFLRSALNAQRKARGEVLLSEGEFQPLLDKVMLQLGMAQEFATRDVNVGFSGGEKKKNELLQMLLFAPQLAILDEIDSGMDNETMLATARHIREKVMPTCAVIVISHYQQFLCALQPDCVHQLSGGKIGKKRMCPCCEKQQCAEEAKR